MTLQAWVVPGMQRKLGEILKGKKHWSFCKIIVWHCLQEKGSKRGGYIGILDALMK
jgi:hypothetical protein